MGEDLYPLPFFYYIKIERRKKMENSKISFRPVKGLESKILTAGYNEGYVYFATDTKKIYLDANGEDKLLMGGSSGIFYGNMTLEEEPSEGQTEFTFTLDQIEGNEDPSRLNIPNVDDLILNIPDGCFYRVTLLEGEGLETVINTEKLTIAGSGGSSEGGDEDLGKFSLTRTTPANITVLFNSPYSIGFESIATDFNGESTGNGTYVLLINNVQKANGIAYQGVNEIPIEQYLTLGENKITIRVSMDIGGSSMVTKTLRYTINATSMDLTWDYNELQINSINSPLTLEWSVSGTGIEKTTHLLIDNLFPIILSEKKTSVNTQTKIFSIDEMEGYGLTHGAHSFKMWVTADLNGNLVSTNPIYKNIIIEDESNNAPIISVGLHQTDLIQHDTIFIPVIYYSRENTASDAIFTFSENGIEIDKQENIENQKVYQCSYTPANPGIQVLSFQSGTTEVSFTINVEELNIDNEEVSGYAFKFKASEFPSNSAVQNWNQNGVNISFSDKFDWINGGLASEVVNGVSRQYMCVKAGSQMTINYKLFKQAPQGTGKVFKIIFRASKCRDYDAQILSCRENRKGVGINTNEFSDMSIPNGVIVKKSTDAQVDKNTNQIVLIEPTDFTINLSEEESRKALTNSFIQYQENIYYCVEVEEYEEDGETYYNIILQDTYIKDTYSGILMQAQNAYYNSLSSSLSVPYCEDSYIEFEIDISKYDSQGKQYIRTWMDGIPCGIQNYTMNDDFTQSNPVGITIGSDDCDVHIYMIKVYEKHLTDEEHLANFIADAPNGNEMLKRFERNDILNPETGEISPTRLASVNKNCRVHIYDIERMTQNKKDPVACTSYVQYHGSDQAVLTAPSAKVKVQGTSSAAYGLAAYNLDAEFEEGFYNEKGEHIDNWSMNENSIGCNYFTTKVNVASCENANNALNQEWYNRFQPYKCVLRCKDPKARDTMEFTPGALFIIDRNKTTNNTSVLTANNVFSDTPGYTNNPYAKLYAICNMGNSKDNTHVFHDQENPLECCVEVGDNQQPQQWMVSDQFGTGDIDDGKEYYGFRYPDKAKNASETMIQGWKDFVSWMAHSNPQPMYEEITINNAEEFAAASINPQTKKPVTLYVFTDPENGVHTEAKEYVSGVTKYYKKTQNLYGYTNEKLPEPKSFDSYTFQGYYAPGYEELQKNAGYVPVIKGCTVTQYATKKMVYDYKYDENGNIIYDKDGTPIIDESTGREEDTPYTHDTYEYRMAKMLSECEQHLNMDSVIYHYLFVERHCMIDNIAKNTFWSTEDCKVWNMIKDYDNDTADGNDNNGKFTRNYGMEVLDKLNENEYVFNAHQSVWLNFIDGLLEAREWMYNALESVEIDGKSYNAWDPNSYLELFEEWQSVVPERVWIEDYYRKYIRPYEVYNDDMFLPMMEGGKKTHQRKQYETYQDYYVSSEYHGQTSSSSWILIRGNGNGKLGYKLPVSVYADCYVRAAIGSGQVPNIRVRAKRNKTQYIECPMDELNNTTFYIYLPQLYQTIGEIDGNNLSGFAPAQVSFVQAPKLRQLIIGVPGNNQEKNVNLRTIGFEGNPLLETLYIANCPNANTGLNLSAATSLKELNAIGSGFTEITIADGAPVEKINLQSPTSLYLSNLTELEEFNIQDYNSLSQISINNIDNSNINSKTILDNARNLDKYYLRNVDWTLNNSDDVNNTNLTIKVLERLLGLEPMLNLNVQPVQPYPIYASLTGKMEITANAYNEDQSFEIYNKYAKANIYPNLDIDFTGSNAELHTVKIYDGNENVYWTRKIPNGDPIDEEFLSTGPNGAFNISAIIKQPTAAETFTKTGNWLVYKDGELDKDPIDTIVEINGSISYPAVNYDIAIVPEFKSEPRSYTLSFHDDLGNLIAEPVTAVYGTPFSQVIPGIVPYKEYTGNVLKAAYNFTGYSLLSGSSTLVPEGYTVNKDQSFYAVFEYIEDISKIVHPEWFTGTVIDYVRDRDNQNLGGDPSFGVKNGIALKIKEGLILQGKITIPAMWEGKPVISLREFTEYSSIDSTVASKQKITHIFMEEGCQIYEIQTRAFNSLNSLVYFDFEPNTIRWISNSAFKRCKQLTNTLLSLNIFYIGNEAFQGSFYSKDAISFIIPPNVQTIGQGAFNYLGFAAGSILQIGTQQNPSRLNFANPIQYTEASHVRFEQNSNSSFHGSDVNFYSSVYSSDIDTIYEDEQYNFLTVSDAFGQGYKTISVIGG